jgi:polyphosphate kinase
MHRNLDRRVEALVRITDPSHIAELDAALDLAMSDATSSWHLEADGTWMRHNRAENGAPLDDMQNVLMREISGRRRSPLR